MPTWKKVVVSGSNISQLNNDSGYLTAVTQQNTFATMSVNGVAVIADSAVDILTFASASGAGLNIVGDSGADSITFNLTNIPGSSLNTTSVANAISGSIYGGVSGDITITSAGVASIAANSVALGTDTTGNYVADVTAGNGIAVTHTPGEGSSAAVALKNNGSLSNNTLVKWTTASTQLANSLITDDGTTVTIGGDLTVTGTTTTINTTNLIVADAFITLASGSSNNSSDGGILIDRGVYAGGNVAYGYDLTTVRWGFQNGLADTTNGITIGTDGNSSFVGLVFTEGAHGATKPTSGEFAVQGAIYSANNGDIWIYSGS